MSILTFTADKSATAIAGNVRTLTWTTSGATYVTLSHDCWTASGSQSAGTHLDTGTSVYIFPVSDERYVLTDDTGDTAELRIKIGFDPARYKLEGGRLRA